MVRRPTILRTFLDLFIVLILVAGAYLIYAFVSKDHPLSHWTLKPVAKAPLSYEENEAKKLEQASRDSQVYNAAIDARDASICDRISDTLEASRCRDAVLASVALSEKNPEKCKTLSASGMVERCQDNITFAEAESTLDRALCEMIMDDHLRSQCREMIDQTLFQAAVSSGVILDQAFCRGFSGSIRTKCESRILTVTDAELYQKALLSRSLSDCDSIVDPKMITRCRDTITFEMAVRDGELSLCDTLLDPLKMKYCRETITSQKDALLYRSIIDGGDINECESIASLPLREQCHDMIIMREVRINQDTRACESLYNTGMIFGCRSIRVEGNP